MASLPHVPPSARTVDRYWLWLVRVLVLVPILLVLAFNAWSWIPGLRSACADETHLLAVVLILMVLPYLASLRHLLAKSLKKGLAWAVVAGGFWCAVSLLIAVANLLSANLSTAPTAGLIALSQGALVGSAIKAYYSMARDEDDRHILWHRVLLFVPYVAFVLLAAVAVPGLIRSRQAAKEALAIGALRTVNRAEVTYRENFHKGYSPTLKVLGPPPSGAQASPTAAGLIDDILATGQKTGYTFTYTPGPVNSAGEITTYTLTAVPSDPRCAWTRYFTYQSGTIHLTGENRAATAQDPPIRE